MKIIKIICLAALTTFTIQQANAQLQKGMLVQGHFNEEGQAYVAEITAVNGELITYRFVHSGSTYIMQKQKTPADPSFIGMHKALVTQTAGGKYKAGSRFTYITYRVSDPDCTLRESGFIQDNVVIVQFPDGKSYLGDISKSGENFQVKFRHSGSIYLFDQNEKILQSNGSYKAGSKANIKCTAAVAHDF